MGVMECYRKNCKNILCDRYSSTYGYICWECFDELVSLGPKTDIESFMNSVKRPKQKDISFLIFNEEFPAISRD